LSDRPVTPVAKESTPEQDVNAHRRFQRDEPKIAPEDKVDSEARDVEIDSEAPDVETHRRI